MTINRLCNMKRQTGFSLVELTVVLLIITLLASVAVRETSELAFQTRYEQTKERLEMIRQAILGNPKLIVNGQQAVSGFVADMGRLPHNLRELIDINGYCLANAAWDNKADCEDAGKGNSTWVTLCSNNNYTDQINCETNNAVWSGRKSFGLCFDSSHVYLSAIDDQTTCLATGNVWRNLFNGGWHGPYLNIASNPDDSDAFTDGWGSVAADNNYGWSFSGNANDLTVISFGRNHPASDPTINCGDDYDADCNLQITQLDHRIPLSSLSVMINTANHGICTGGGACSDPAYVTQADCETPRATWSSCSNPIYTTELACTDNGGQWLPGTCSNNTYMTQTECTAPNGSWVLAHCSDPSYTDQSSCTAVSRGTWYPGSCSDSISSTEVGCTAPKGSWDANTSTCSDPTYVNQADCEAPRGSWTFAYCSDAQYTTEAECVMPRETWYPDQCSAPSFTTQAECEAPKGDWTSAPQGVCSDPKYTTEATCTAPHGEWIVPSSSASKRYCEAYLGTWQSTSREVCAVVFHRRNGNLEQLYSGNVTISENGQANQVTFSFPANSFVSQGVNLISVYSFDGDCNPDNPLYPPDHQTPIQVDFHPHTALPVINW